jgi:hypothetical protein
MYYPSPLLLPVSVSVHVRTPPSLDPVVVTAPTLPVPTRDISPPVVTSTLATHKATSSPCSNLRMKISSDPAPGFCTAGKVSTVHVVTVQ